MPKIVTQLVKQAAQSGISHLFLFTKPSYQTVFTDMGFYKIIATDTMLLLENRKDGIVQYLKSEAAPFLAVSSDVSHPVSAIVMNANPFTKGHNIWWRQQPKKAVSYMYLFYRRMPRNFHPMFVSNLLKRAVAICLTSLYMEVPII